MSKFTQRTDLIEKAREVIDDAPLLIHLVSQRVRQLNQGRPALVRPPQGLKRVGTADLALAEIIEGRIRPETPEIVDPLEL